MGRGRDASARKTSLNFRTLLEMFIGTIIGGLQYSKICSLSWHHGLMCGQQRGEGAECSSTRLHPWPPLDYPPLTPSHFSRARPWQAQQPSSRIQGCFIYGFNNGASWETFGFPFPEAKMHLQNVLEIYYCLCFFPTTTFSEPPYSS